ncbi:MAG: serine hydrolase domain-containing protein, partial [Myxococcota bacterium]
RGVTEGHGFGDSAVLQLTVNGIGNFSRNLRYELTSGPGRLVLDPQGGPPRYEAPADDGSSVLGPAVITVTPIPPGPLGPAPFPGPGLSLTIPVIPPDAIPASGLGWAGTEPLDNAVRDFMRYRCVGAAALTVMRNGTVIYRKGFGRMDGPASVAKFPGCGTDAEDPHRSGSGVLTSHTPFGLGSLSKAIAAATLRWLVRARMEQIGRSGDVEDQMLLDPELNLLPADVRNVLNGTASPYALEVPFMDLAPNRSSDCDSEGTSAWNGTDCLCNFGYSGQRCSYNNVACAGTNANQPGAVPTAADTRWQDMTIGHLLSHRAGLPRDFSNTTFLLPNLAVIRGLSTEADWQGQQDALASGLEPRGLDDDLLAAQSTLDSEGIENPYFVPWVLPGDNPIDELLTAYGSACLESRPGQVYAYSNWGYVIIGRIIERLHGSNRYTALLGQPDTHPGSALAQFLASEFSLGNGLGSDYGIYADPQSVGVSLFTPAKRLWTASPASYYDPQTDRKWPVCSWNGTTCSFSDWRNSNNNVRFNGEWTRDPVPPWQARSGVWNNGWAGIAAELPLYARFMNRFWISGYNQWASEDNADPFIGEEWLVGDSRRTAHTGLVTGARAVAEYLGAARDWTLTLPPVVGGRIVDDESNTGFRNASDYPPDGSSETCSLPSGLTYVFAVNNSSDRRCIPEPGEDSGNAAVCSREYALMDDFIKFG